MFFRQLSVYMKILVSEIESISLVKYLDVSPSKCVGLCFVVVLP